MLDIFIANFKNIFNEYIKLFSFKEPSIIILIISVLLFGLIYKLYMHPKISSFFYSILVISTTILHLALLTQAISYIPFIHSWNIKQLVIISLLIYSSLDMLLIYVSCKRANYTISIWIYILGKCIGINTLFISILTLLISLILSNYGILYKLIINHKYTYISQNLPWE